MRVLLVRLLTIIVFIVGVGQLAVSQIHISAATKIFANQIGIYLFIFIIFGLTTGFNAVLIDKPRSVLSLIVSGLIAAGGGFVYLRLLQADVVAQETLTMADVNNSWWMVIFSIVIYLIGAIVVPLLSWPEVRAA